MINQIQVGMANTLAERLASIPGVKSAKVDDWSDEGYFAIFVQMQGEWTGGYKSRFIPKGENLAMDRPSRKNRRAVRVIGRLIRSVLTEAKKADEIYSFETWAPEGQYHVSYGYNNFDGYDKDDFKLNVRIPEDFPVSKDFPDEKTAENKKPVYIQLSL